MKKLIFTLALCLMTWLTFAQTVSITVSCTAGGLKTANSNLANATDLTITGTMDARDFRYLQQITCEALSPKLKNLDISAVSIAANSSLMFDEGTDTNTSIYLANQIPPSTFNDPFNSKAYILLQSIKLPTSITSIGANAFKGCTGLTAITVPSAVTAINNYALQNCTGLKTLILPATLTTIGTSAFAGCTGLTLIRSLKATVPTTTPSTAFTSISTTNCTIQVPTAAAVLAYQAANYWKTFTNIIEIPLSVITTNTSSITTTTATLNGNVENLGTISVTAYGFCWNTATAPTITNSKIDKGACSATGVFTSNISSLNPGTKYYVRSYATNSSGVTTYGNEVTFTTAKEVDILTNSPTAVLVTTATLNGQLNFLVAGTVQAYGFCWNETGTPTITDNIIDKGTCSANVTLSHNLANLTTETTYFVRAFVTKDGFTQYGAEKSFTTAAVPASSNVGGTYSTSQYWPKSGSPYTLTEDANFMPGTTLTIDPGVTVNYGGAFSIVLFADATGNTNVIANGLATDSITFNSNQNACTFFTFMDAGLASSQISFVKILGKKTPPIYLSDPATYTPFILTSGTCTGSITVNNSRVENSSIESSKNVIINNSKINNSSCGSTYVVANTCTINTTSFTSSSIFKNCTSNKLDFNTQNGSGNTFVDVLNTKLNNAKFQTRNTVIKILNSTIKTSTFTTENNSEAPIIRKSKFSGCSFTESGMSYSTPLIMTLDSTILLNTSLSVSGQETINTNYCIFKNDTSKIVSFKGAVTYSQAIGSSNLIGGVGITDITGTITYSNFINKRNGIRTSSLTANYCNFLNNTFNLVNTSTAAIDAKNNYWGGSTNSTTIGLKIYDKLDKPTLLGTVTFTGAVSTPNINTPITPPQNFSKSEGTGGITYTWNANTETDIKGYKLYYGTTDGLTFASSVDVGNVTTYTLANVGLYDKVLLTAYDLLADGKDDMIEGHESWYTDDILPAKAGKITGTTNICIDQYNPTTQATYTVPTIENATSYVWTIPTGAIGTSSTNSIDVTYNSSSVSGDITVKGHNAKGDGQVSTLAVVVNQPVGNPGQITGLTKVCRGSNSVTYTVPPITNATTYVWELPTGITGTSTTNSITVDFTNVSPTYNYFMIYVYGENGCNGMRNTTSISIQMIDATIGDAGTISGSASVVQGQKSVTYTVPSISNAISYVWTLPDGATGTSTTNSITVDYAASAVSGNITVKGQNDCAIGTASILAITVNKLPDAAGTITGKTAVCQGETLVTYNVPTITDATSYIWTLPTGASGTSTTNSITVDYGNSAVSGDVTVKGHNTYGDGVASTLTVTVSQLPTITLQNKNAIYNQEVSLNPTIGNYTEGGVLEYTWTPATGLNDNKLLNPTATVTKDVTYTLTVKTPNQCSVTKTVDLKLVAMPKPAICMVGIDANNKNSVVWDKAVSTGIDSYYIYRETNVTGVYEKIATVPYNALSVYTDENSQPDVQSNKYKISIYDLGTLESTQSDAHKTMHLAINKGQGTTWNLIWEAYEGFAVPTYNVYRGTSAANLGLIGSTSGTSTQYSDVNAPTGDVYYQLEVVNPSPCNPTGIAPSKVKGVQNSGSYTLNGGYTSSRSNIATNVPKISTSLNAKQINDSFKVYPNPIQHQLNIEYDGTATYELINLMGQVLTNGKLTNSTIIQTGHLNAGVYLIKLNTGKQYEYKRIVKE